MRKCLLIISGLLVFFGCEYPTQFSRQNTNDPNSNSFEPDSIKNFMLSVLDDRILLEWDQGSSFVEGYLIEKTTNTQTYEDIAALDVEETTFEDKEISPFTGKYRLQYIDSSGNYDNPPITQEYDINPENFSIVNYPDNLIELQWDKNTYFNSIIRLEWKSNSDPYLEINSLQTSLGRYQITDLNQKFIGENKFRLTEFTDEYVSKSLTTSEIRLPVWKNPGAVKNADKTGYMIRYGDMIYSFIYDFDFGYKSHKHNLSDFKAETIQSPPQIDNINGFSSLDVIGDKILALGNTNKYSIYDPQSDNWSVFQDTLLDNRVGASRVALDDHRLLVSGGASKTANGEVYKSSLIYDLNLNSWTDVADLNTSRYEHMSLKMDNGQVFVAGNKTERHVRTSAEIYHPDTGTWQLVKDPPITPYLITKLSSGRVLVVSEHESIEFDPTTLSWVNRTTYELDDYIPKSITNPILYKLPDGNAILAGMIPKEIDNTVGEDIYSQIYIADQKKWYRIGNLNFSLQGYALPTLLNNDDLIIIHRSNWKGIPYEILEYSKYQ